MACTDTSRPVGPRPPDIWCFTMIQRNLGAEQSRGCADIGTWRNKRFDDHASRPDGDLVGDLNLVDHRCAGSKKYETSHLASSGDGGIYRNMGEVADFALVIDHGRG